MPMHIFTSIAKVRHDVKESLNRFIETNCSKDPIRVFFFYSKGVTKVYINKVHRLNIVHITSNKKHQYTTDGTTELLRVNDP